jgi:hypothetical protein
MYTFRTPIAWTVEEVMLAISFENCVVDAGLCIKSGVLVTLSAVAGGWFIVLSSVQWLKPDHNCLCMIVSERPREQGITTCLLQGSTL